MSYKMPKLEDKRKLCPRCGSPLMDMGKFLKCPLCGYSKSLESETRTVIKYAEPDAVKKKVAPKIFQVLPSGLSAASQLATDGVYLITDPEKNTIWLWKGTESRPKDVYNAGTAATRLKTSEKMYSANLVRVDEGNEPPEFPSVSGKEPISKEMVSEAQEALSIEPPSEGQANIYLIEKGELKKIDQPVFTTGDSYIVDAGSKIWIWIGEHASVDEKFSAAHLSTVIDVSRRGEPKVISVEQGTEPHELRTLLGGLKVVDKNVAETLLKKVEKEIYEPVLYRISSEEFETINDIIYKQVPCTKDSLDSEDVFLLDDRTNDKTYIWIGSKSNVKEKVIAGQIARKFEVERAGVQEEIFIEEGEEPEEFKNILGIP
jgi:ribosomal protein S27AE